MSLVEKTTHVSDAQEKTLGQFEFSSLLNAFLEMYGNEALALEALFFELKKALNPAEVSGMHLDLIGKIVGQDRMGLEDEPYRVWLTARLAINKASGLWPELTAVLNALGYTDRTYYEYYPASVVITLGNVTDAAAAAAYGVINEMRSAGVKIDVVYNNYAFSDVFTFGTSAEETIDALLGFGDSDSPTSGGHFSNLAGLIDLANYFTLATTAIESTSTTKGFGESTTPSTGGKFVFGPGV